jgi:hypothetical protein
MLSSTVPDLATSVDPFASLDDLDLARELAAVGGDLEKDLVRRRHVLIRAASDRGWSTYKIAEAARVSQPSVSQLLTRKKCDDSTAAVEGMEHV